MNMLVFMPDMHSWLPLHSRAPVWWWAGRRTLRDWPCTAFCIAWEGRWEGVRVGGGRMVRRLGEAAGQGFGGAAVGAGRMQGDTFLKPLCSRILCRPLLQAGPPAR